MTFAAAPDAVVTVHPPPLVTLMVGGAVEVRIGVAVADGYHIQSNPASGAFLIPVRLELRAKSGVHPREPAYPPGRPYRLQGAPNDLMVYEGTFEIVVSLEASESARPGSRILQGVLRYQACDERSCLFPASTPVKLTLQVVPESDK